MSEGNLICGFCSENLNVLAIAEREDHYEAHFLAFASEAELPQTSQRTANRGTGPKKRFHPTLPGSFNAHIHKAEKDVFWHPSLGTPPPNNYTPGLIPILTHSLNALCSKGKITQAVLCHERLVHIGKEHWDATWGCGYRNFLTVCTGLLEQEIQPLYRHLLDTSPQPSVRNLQTWIQHAWDDGYDQTGCKELKNKIIGTNKWIGTAEIYIALCHRGIPAELIDFNGFKDKGSCAIAIAEWMVRYFTSQTNDRPCGNINDVLGKTSPVVVTQLMPVILQHRGHSRVIVGYQRDKDGCITLLTFDTGRLLPQALKDFAKSSSIEKNKGNIAATHAKPGSPSELPLGCHSADGEQHTSLSSRPTVEHNDERTISSVDALTAFERASGNDRTDHEGKSKHVVNHPRKEPSKIIPNPGRMQRVFTLTAKQLALHAEYQVLYIPFRAPLTEAEKLNKKVIRSKRITGESITSMSL